MTKWKVLTWTANIIPEADDYSDPKMLRGKPLFLRFAGQQNQIIGPEDCLEEIEIHVFYDLGFPKDQYTYVDFDPKDFPYIVF